MRPPTASDVQPMSAVATRSSPASNEAAASVTRPRSIHSALDEFVVGDHPVGAPVDAQPGHRSQQVGGRSRAVGILLDQRHPDVGVGGTVLAAGISSASRRDAIRIKRSDSCRSPSIMRRSDSATTPDNGRSARGPRRKTVGAEQVRHLP